MLAVCVRPSATLSASRRSCPSFLPSNSLRCSRNLRCLAALVFERTRRSRVFPMAPVNLVAESAKSGRSSCKVCGRNIQVGSLRLGLSSRDPRGFESVKWHHPTCLPVPRPFPGLGQIKGFNSLNRADQEALRNLSTSAAANHPPDVDQDSVKEDSTRRERSPKMNKVLRDTFPPEDEGTLLKKPKQGDGEKSEEIPLSLSDIKMMYKDAVLPAGWKAFKTVIFRLVDDDHLDSGKIGAFDFDGCLAKTSLGRIGADKWSLMYPSIPSTLRSLHEDGYKLVVFTNESNIDRWKNKRQLAIDSKIGRLENFMQCVGVPMQVFIACGLGKGKGNKPDDPFRKPNPGMWWLMEKHFNSHIQIDMEGSFYVGDAAGRDGDHSDADIEFAKAVGVRFLLPEEVFRPSSKDSEVASELGCGGSKRPSGW